MTSLKSVFEAVRVASRKLNLLDEATINAVLCAVADEAVAQSGYILAENACDLAKMDKNNPKYDRLMLTEQRLVDIAADMRRVAELPSPLGKVLSETTRPNGMTITKISVPFGVIGIIYEARPNVSFDVFSLCLKSGNACILKGGSDAACSNAAIVNVINKVLIKFGIDSNTVCLLPNDREATTQLLTAVDYVDLIIPRGSKGLIEYVRDNARVPVIETGAGICHTYFESSGDVKKGAAIINNAKTRRVSVCNALDCLVIDSSRLADLPELCAPLEKSRVIIYADPAAYSALQGKYPAELLLPADEESFGTEFLDYKMAIKTVAGIDEALDHICRYSSRHSESIISENDAVMQRFCKEVDAACVYTNVSTAFTDGGQFGFGAEIGISTQKLHARGPMALPEITTYKYIIQGDGQTR
ncbi:glutamate-5-semialdehyde dehydrogenase [uncultured Coprobacter sp.]|uniref:glutamate-5-semialdehyde dehydrogenase n=1 Tax=uncultured Coprobacter sp. TaxID=1720550 RepID=UPI002616CBC8|nr:glutamate-5-semialdehyde dehydrogenase [uncultured Coprobacter sp.]